MKLFLASGSTHKAAELATLSQRDGLGVGLFSAGAVGGMPAVEEDTGTLAGNARLKALALRTRLPADGWALADDSGLCVDALGGGPGVESAHYAGSGATDAENLAKLTAAMRDVPEGKRGAHFRCVLLLIGPDGSEHVFEGRCDGRLLHEPRGRTGFGYDPLFVPDGHARSFAELGEAVKNGLSHRARAWARLAEWLKGGK